MEGARLLHILARGLSQATANLLATSLGLGPIHCQVECIAYKKMPCNVIRCRKQGYARRNEVLTLYPGICLENTQHRSKFESGTSRMHVHDFSSALESHCRARRPVLVLGTRRHSHFTITQPAGSCNMRTRRPDEGTAFRSRMKWEDIGLHHTSRRQGKVGHGREYQDEVVMYHCIRWK
jgi:hypothetical protein